MREGRDGGRSHAHTSSRIFASQARPPFVELLRWGIIAMRRPSPRHTRDVVACWFLHAKEKRKRQTQTKGEEEEADTATPRGKRKRQPHNFNHFLTNQPHN